MKLFNRKRGVETHEIKVQKSFYRALELEMLNYI